MAMRDARRLFRACGVAVGVFALTPIALVGQGQGQALPPAADLVARFVAAVGGEAARKAISSIHVRGTFEMAAQGVSGSMEVFSARPGKMLQRVQIAQMGLVEAGFDGKVGWELSPLTGPALVTGRRLTEMADDSWFDEKLHAPDHVRSLTTVAKTEFDNRPAYQVKLVYTSGTELVEYFDVETGLVIGSESTRDSPMGVLPATSILRDYRKFGSLSEATTQLQRLMGIEQTLRLSSFEYDTVPASMFDLPPQIKALIK
jgi:hypothetical protein